MSCIVVKVKKDFYMQDGDHAFTKGNHYVFISDNKEWKTVDDQGDVHFMSLKDMQELDPNFTGVE